MVTPFEEASLRVVHGSDTPPNSPTFIFPSGSGALHGLSFSNPSASRQSSPLRQDGSLPSGSNVSLDSILAEHAAGRTNLANCFESIVPEKAVHNRLPSCPGAFSSDPRASQITAQFAGEAEEGREEEGDEWVHEIEDTNVGGKVKRDRISTHGSRKSRRGRRPVRFFGNGPSKLTQTGEQTCGVEQVAGNRAGTVIEDDCASGSCHELFVCIIF